MIEKIPELETYLGQLIRDAVSFDAQHRAPHRSRALEYLRGEMRDTPAGDGWSQMTTSELSDAVSWVMPGLMRIFSGSSGVVTYEATEQADEQAASDATEYVQEIFETECDGYRVLFGWFHDALVTRNGVVKYWWDDTKKYGPEKSFVDLEPDQITMVMDNPAIEVTGQQEDKKTGLISIRTKEIRRHGSLRVEPVPPEEFLISQSARTIDDAPLVGHRQLKTRSDLIEMGYEPDEVNALPAYRVFDDTATDDSRSGFSREFSKATAVSALEPVEFYECYLRFDLDDDGVAELIRVCAAGPRSGPKVLREKEGKKYEHCIEEWEDEIPFADITPQFVPHSWQGRSIADDTMDLQRLKTVLLRQTLDNLYLSNRPQTAVDVAAIENPDEVLNPTIGGVIRVKGDPSKAIRQLTVPFVAKDTLAAMTYVDNLLQRRTGVSQSALNLDSGALVPQTATAAQKEHDASYSKVELIARNFAETGVKRLFRGLLKLLTKYQKAPHELKVKGQWKPFTPSEWADDMIVRVNVGLGTGTRERDLAMLRMIGMEQDKVIESLGPDNPVVPIEQWLNTRQRMIGAAGIKDADLYFAPVSTDDFKAWMAQRAQNAPPDPRMAQAQAKAQTDRMAVENKLQLQAQEMQGKLALKAAEMQQEAELSAIEMATKPNGDGGKYGNANIRGAV